MVKNLIDLKRNILYIISVTHSELYKMENYTLNFRTLLDPPRPIILKMKNCLPLIVMDSFEKAEEGVWRVKDCYTITYRSQRQKWSREQVNTHTSLLYTWLHSGIFEYYIFISYNEILDIRNVFLLVKKHNSWYLQLHFH